MTDPSLDGPVTTALRNEIEQARGPSAGFTESLMRRVRLERSSGGSLDVFLPRHESRPLLRSAVLAAAAVLVVAIGASIYAFSHGFGDISTGNGPDGMADLSAPSADGVSSEEVSSEEWGFASVSSVDISERKRPTDLRRRASNLRRVLKRLIDLQDDDGAWSRLRSKELPLDAVGLSAFAFRAYTKLGGSKTHPETGERALNYLLRRQRDDGSFSSSLLTTAVVVNVLQEWGAEDERADVADYISRGKRFLRRRQNSDGVWTSETGSERDNLLATVFALRVLRDDEKIGRAQRFLERKTESLLRELERGGDSEDKGDLDLRMALCLAARVHIGDEPSRPDIRRAAEVLFERMNGPVDPLGLYFRGVVAAHSGGELWSSFRHDIESDADRGEGSHASDGGGDFDWVEVLSLALLQDARG